MELRVPIKLEKGETAELLAKKCRDEEWEYDTDPCNEIYVCPFSKNYTADCMSVTAEMWQDIIDNGVPLEFWNENRRD